MGSSEGGTGWTGSSGEIGGGVAGTAGTAGGSATTGSPLMVAVVEGGMVEPFTLAVTLGPEGDSTDTVPAGGATVPSAVTVTGGGGTAVSSTGTGGSMAMVGDSGDGTAGVSTIWALRRSRAWGQEEEAEVVVLEAASKAARSNRLWLRLRRIVFVWLCVGGRYISWLGHKNGGSVCVVNFKLQVCWWLSWHMGAANLISCDALNDAEAKERGKSRGQKKYQAHASRHPLA